MKVSSILLTHLGVALLGVIFALSALRQPSEGSSSGDRSERNPASSLRRAAATRSTKSLERSLTSRRQDFERMWDALPSQEFSREERLTTQQRILYEWAKVDLRGALKAAIKEASILEFREGYSRFDPFINDRPFANVFDDAFQQNPEASWDLIQSEELKFGGNYLRPAWCRAVASLHTGLLLEKISGLSGWEQKEAVQLIADNKANLMDRKSDVAEILKQLPAANVGIENLLPFLEKRSPEEIGNALAQVGDLSQREGRILIAELVGTNNIYASSEKSAQAIQSLRESKDRIPSEVFGEIVFQTMGGAFSESYYPGTTTGKNTLELIDLMIESESWTQLANDRTVARLDSHTNALPSEDLAAWAVNLPEREELAELFDRGVDNYISENIDLAWDWIQSFPDGKWRDRALAEYSQQTLKVNNDYEDSLRAIEAIADPKLRESTRAELNRLVQD